MKKTVDELIEELILVEGGYVNHPNDRGGPTRWGITETVARRYGYHGDMKVLPKDFAKKIYRQRYLDEPGFDCVLERSEMIAAELFDTGVNAGPGRASQFLQRALNLLNRNGRDYPELKVDGDVGPKTLAALDAFLAARKRMDGEVVLFRLLNAMQGELYMALAEKDPSQEDFLFGWFRYRVA